MKRKVMTLDEIRQESDYYQITHDDDAGICALVDVENMGWCKSDDKTRFYMFTNANGEPAIYFKH